MVDFIFENCDKTLLAQLLVILGPLDQRSFCLADGTERGGHVGKTSEPRLGRSDKGVPAKVSCVFLEFKTA